MVFRAFVALFWILLFLPGSTDTVQFSATYLLLVGSACLFVLVYLPFVLHRALVEKPLAVRWETVWLFGMGGLAGAVAILRGDISTFVTVSLLVIVLVIITELELVLSVAYLNGLAIASVPVAIASYHLGLSDYGYVPGQAVLGEEQGLAWRVSMFPGLAENGFFCSLVLLANICYRRQRHDFIAVGIAAYFLLFSGVRSAMLGLALAVGFWVWTRILRGSGSRMALFAATVGLIVASPFAPELVVVGLQALDWEPLWTLTKIDPSVVESGIQDSSSLRAWIWSEHLRLWWSSPALLGTGTFDFSAVALDPPFGHVPGNGSESFLTSMLARIGIPALFLVGAIVQAVRHGLQAGNAVIASFAIVLFAAMLTYGSILTPYNLLFFLLFSALNAPDPGVLARPSGVSSPSPLAATGA